MNEYSYEIIKDFLFLGQISEGIKYYFQCKDSGNLLDNEKDELFNILVEAAICCSMEEHGKEVDLEYRIKRKNGDKREKSIIKNEIVQQYLKILQEDLQNDIKNKKENSCG